MFFGRCVATAPGSLRNRCRRLTMISANIVIKCVRACVRAHACSSLHLINSPAQAPKVNAVTICAHTHTRGAHDDDVDHGRAHALKVLAAKSFNKAARLRTKHSAKENQALKSEINIDSFITLSSAPAHMWRMAVHFHRLGESKYVHVGYLTSDNSFVPQQMVVGISRSTRHPLRKE